MAGNSSCVNDNSFGPAVVGCRDDFDFTVVFERIIFSIIPSSVFITAALLRIVYLASKPKVLAGRNFQLVKLGAITINAGVAASIVVRTCIKHHTGYRTGIAAAVLSLIDVALLFALSMTEHSRSFRTSIVLITYLFFSLLFDVVQTRTLWLSEPDSLFNRLFTTGVALKIGILVLEAQGKGWWTTEERNPEETSGIFNLSFLAWLNRLILKGYRVILSVNDLYILDHKLSAEAHQEEFSIQWERSKSHQRYRLLWTTARTLQYNLLAPIIPRLILSAFTFCQPFLISSILDYLQQALKEDNRNVGYGFIGAAAIVYTGIAVCTGFYWRLHQRSLSMLRACLVAALYRRATELQITDVKDSAAITLMSTDVGRILGGFRDLHECWANFIEVAVACWLLERQIGAAFVAPLAVVVFCVTVSAYLGRYMGRRQRSWMDKVQRRVGLTARTVSYMASIKLSGLVPQVTHIIHNLRKEELKSAARFRIFTAFAAVIAFTPLLISPAIMFAVTAEELTVSRVFTALAYLQMLSSPLTQLFQSIPQILAALTCFARIETFLERLPRSSNDPSDTEQTRNEHTTVNRSTTAQAIQATDSQHEIQIHEGQFGWKETIPVLKDMSIAIPHSKFTIIVGPTASGKSTLCKALLGEMPFTEGHILRRSQTSRVAFCDQTPFLTHASIQENIIGFGMWDAAWYNRVIDATALREDLMAMSGGDQAETHRTARTLSGGQQSRVALARALYVRPELAIFDDIFHGLDAKTAKHIFTEVFGSDGILRQLGSTVVLSTQASIYLTSADNIIVLDGGRVVENGTLEELMALKKHVYNLNTEGETSHTSSANAERSSIISTLAPERPVETGSNETSYRQRGDVKLYRFYFSMVGVKLVVPGLICGASFAFLYNFSSVWLEFWSDGKQDQKHSSMFYAGIYALLQVVCLSLLAVFSIYHSMVMVAKASLAIHSKALQTMMNAVPAYFSSVEIGVTTNYFSQDMSIIDNDLAGSLSNTILTGFTAMGQGAVIATASPYLLVGYPILVSLLYVIQKIYLRTSRQLRLLDLETKAPLYTHFIETLEGLATIRAFGWISSNISHNNRLLNESQRPLYLLSMIQQWLTLVLNMSVAVLAISVIALATQLRSSAGFTGVSLVSLMTFGEMLTNLIRCFTELETSIGAVSRLKQFSESVPSEKLSSEVQQPSDEWPNKGRILIRNVSAAYENFKKSELVARSQIEKSTAPALHNISLTIEPAERVAVCGRTGSGKSSILNLLLRLLNPHNPMENGIVIDNVPINTVDCLTLRKRIISLPQSPFFLHSGNTFRENLEFYDDRFKVLQDSEFEYALKAVKLWEVVSDRGGLDAEFEQDSLSRGQIQLFSLARVIIRARLKKTLMSPDHSDAGNSKGGLLLLDEFTSSVDEETAKLMQDIVNREFEAYTVLYVAHRLQPVFDFDKVIVMEKGEIIEVGKPDELLGREGGAFRALWTASEGREDRDEV